MLRCAIHQYVAIPLIKQVVTLFRNLKTTGVIISFSSATKLEASLHLASYHVNRLEVTQWEAPVRGLQGSNWRQNKMHCCGIPPPTQSPCSLARVYSSHGCWGAVRAQLLCVWSARICQCTCVGAFPVHSIIHFSPCHSFAPFFVLIFSIPPTLFWSLSSFLSHSLSVTKTCTCTHLSTHARGWHGRVPENQHGLAWGYAKKYKNRCGTTA